jgi:hypothetical protein
VIDQLVAPDDFALIGEAGQDVAKQRAEGHAPSACKRRPSLCKSAALPLSYTRTGDERSTLVVIAVHAIESNRRAGSSA